MENLIVDCSYGQINTLISVGMTDPDPEIESQLPEEF
jgi:hypothetical protein